MHVPIIIIVLWLVVLVSLLVLTALQYRHLALARKGYDQLSESYDRALLDLQKQKDAARAVVPFLAKTSVAMFYGEKNGEQYSFQQRQEIAGRVQSQNSALRRFNDVFGIGVTAELMARAGYGDPEAQAAVEELRRAEDAKTVSQYVEELGPDSDLPPATSSPWPGLG